MNEMALMKQITTLEAVVSDAMARLSALEEGLGGDISPYQALDIGLTPSEARILALLVKRGRATRGAISHALYGSSDTPTTLTKVIDVLVSKMRKRVRPLGVVFKTIRAENNDSESGGYVMSEPDRDKVKALLRERGRAAA